MDQATVCLVFRQDPKITAILEITKEKRRSMAYENLFPPAGGGDQPGAGKALVYAEGCNRQYDGEVKRWATRCAFLAWAGPPLPITTDKAITLSAPERGGQQRDACRPADQLFN